MLAHAPAHMQSHAGQENHDTPKTYRRASALHTEPRRRPNICGLTVAEYWCPRNPKKCKLTMSQTHIARNTTRSTRSKLYDQETLNQKSSDAKQIYIHTSGKNWWQRIDGHKMQSSKFNKFQKIGTAVPKMPCYRQAVRAGVCQARILWG